MTRYEYKIIRRLNDDLSILEDEENINKMADEGWELVFFSTFLWGNYLVFIYILKRVR
jgi:hypothetical protein